MRIIKKIEIEKFRSFGIGKKGNTIECNHLNILSGKNNSGKSNILKALNLFFNQETSFNERFEFEKDYNIAYTGSYGGHIREIKIRVYFFGTGSGILKNDFYIERIFKQKGIGITTKFYYKKDEEKNYLEAKKGRETSQFNTFLNKITFMYIPAVREKRFIQNIFTYLQLILDKDKKDKENYQNSFTNITDVLTQRTEVLSKSFEKFISLPTSVEAPSRISDILEGISIQTDPKIRINKKVKGESVEQFKKINAYSSGDGIIMSYLPYFLDYLSKQLNNKKFIWGFEEPENSLEYSKTQDLSDQFLNEFSKKSQIFLTTHNPAFIFLKDNKEKVSFYRVYKEEWTNEKLSKAETETGLEKQISLFDKKDDFENAKQLEQEISFIEFSKDTEKFAIEARREKEEFVIKSKKIEVALKKQKNILIVEGDYDIKYLKKASELLNKKTTLEKIQVFEANGFGGLDKIWRHYNTKLSEIVPQKILLLYDCDTRKTEVVKGKICKKIIPSIDESPIKRGIENLFSKETIERSKQYNDSFIDFTSEIRKIIRGEEIIEKEEYEVNKDEKGNLCNWICKNGTKDDFKNFFMVIEIIEKVFENE